MGEKGLFTFMGAVLTITANTALIAVYDPISEKLGVKIGDILFEDDRTGRWARSAFFALETGDAALGDSTERGKAIGEIISKIGREEK